MKNLLRSFHVANPCECRQSSPSWCGDFSDSIINVIAFVVKPNELVIISSFVYEILTYTRSVFIRIHPIEQREEGKKKQKEGRKLLSFFILPYRGKKIDEIFTERIGRNYIILRIAFILSANTGKKLCVFDLERFWSLGALEYIFHITYSVYISI